MRGRGGTVVVAAALALAFAAPSPLAAGGQARSGAEVWGAACAACHGADGAGQPRALVGFDVKLPDLRDCTFATSEPTADWFAVVHEGGTVRGLNQMMPAFRGALSDPEIAAVVDYLRGFCRDLPAWPLGELNLPRALFTEKAFPENEVVLTSTISLGGPGSLTSELIYEQRLGPRTMFEVGVPFGIVDPTPSGGWTAGLGDLGFAVKHALVHSAGRGSILSIGLDVSVPTAGPETGLGAGTTVVDPFLAFGQILPAGGFVQAHAGFDLPVQAGQTRSDLFWRAALGWSISPRRYGRMISPMVEVLGTREIDVDGAVALWDVAPEAQVTLSRRKHVRFDVGARVPLNQTADRHVQLAAYLLWDWGEGSPFEGW
ncbi:MAG TPA: c-type cytochrome [Polyangia bacterium]|nr:c-type cytochrome [Polyangia bacterium]